MLYLLVKIHINQAILNNLCSYACPSIFTTQLTTNMLTNNNSYDCDGDDYNDYNSSNNNTYPPPSTHKDNGTATDSAEQEVSYLYGGDGIQGGHVNCSDGNM